jgi:hypothetical protein
MQDGFLWNHILEHFEPNIEITDDWRTSGNFSAVTFMAGFNIELKF